LSVQFLPQGSDVMDKVFIGLREWGVIGAFRKPDVIRFTPVPLYNTEEEVEVAVRCLDIVMAGLGKECTGSVRISQFLQD